MIKVWLLLIKPFPCKLLQAFSLFLSCTEVRATILSINSLIFRIGFALVAPIIGAIASGYDLFAGLITAGCFFLISGCFFWWQLVKAKAF